MKVCRYLVSLSLALALGACSDVEPSGGRTQSGTVSAGDMASTPIGNNPAAVAAPGDGSAGGVAVPPVVTDDGDGSGDTGILPPPGSATRGLGEVDPSRIVSEGVFFPQIPPGGEATMCITKHLTNDTELKVVEIRASISYGSHHFIVDRSDDSVNIPVLTPCPGLAGTDQTRVLIAETPETVWTMPEGVAFTLRPRQNLTLELHYINYGDETIDIEGRIDFILAEEGKSEGLQEAGMIFTGNPLLLLNPGTTTVIEFFGAPVSSPADPTHVFAMTSHMHSLGTHATIERVAAANSPPGEIVHESWDWASPPLDQYEPDLTFTGSDGLRLKCEFNNTTDQLVTFGTRFHDEMCFMWLYYWPNKAALF